MSIARRLVSSGGGGAAVAFSFDLTVTAGQTYTLPLFSVGGTQPSISVSWGDGTADSIVTSTNDVNRTHTYSSGGTYTVNISGSLPGFRVDNDSFRLLYSSINSFGNVGLRQINFYGCSNITSLSGISDLDGLARVTQFNNTFRGTGITSIPSGFFDNATSAQEFTDTFSFTGITSVPNNLFDNAGNGVASFNSCFLGCLSLTTVPTNMFQYNTAVLSFSSTFRNCRALTNIPTFVYNSSATLFSNIFNMSSTTNGSSSWDLDEALWLRTPTPLGTNAYNNCTGIGTNPSSIYDYNDIPLNWK